jgi:hypothetical protein
VTEDSAGSKPAFSKARRAMRMAPITAVATLAPRCLMRCTPLVFATPRRNSNKTKESEADQADGGGFGNFRH